MYQCYQQASRHESNINPLNSAQNYIVVLLFTIASTDRIMTGVVQKCGGILHLLLFASMLTASFSILSVAPGDFVSECVPFAQPGSFNNSDQKVVLDTQFYQSTTLLTAVGDDGLWISIDFDMTTGSIHGKVRKMKESYVYE